MADFYLRKFGVRLWYLCRESEVADDRRQDVVVVVGADQDVLKHQVQLVPLFQ